MERILAALGHPENQLPPVVHVTGTNGKGSVLAFLRAMLEAAGLRVHVYTSPHLVHFHERIRLAGELISEDHLSAVLDECEAVNAGEEITYFEITTAAAFLAFSRTPADVVLLENGLGGRLDATNVVARPAATAITPVSMDHQQFLGNSLAEIATEKAGIIKPNVPCIVGPQHPDAMDVIVGHTEARGAPLLEWGVNWRAHPDEAGRGMVFEHHGTSVALPMPALPGAHQIVNAGHAAAIARTLDFVDVTDRHIETGLGNVDWPARLQRLKAGPILDALPDDWEVWLDGGHNPDAGETIARFAGAQWNDRPLFLIAGMINSKHPSGYFRPLADVAESVRCVTIPGEDAAIPAGDLAALVAGAGLKAHVADSALAAATAIAAEAGKSARVLICGSLYFAGRILAEHR
ncbi:MAG: bifunctional folylpolyglutamate synthase/dihydrofolate synthase [Rhodospirillales bacterium]|nr:bifunctional folylpolyglutamate synthase/dihydrofolate synthase [Rhodospirillales bacterium]MBO6787886.1 bifunctional folylpolyglutamate synthase/dihydrofolate synthase [Rhodospirillales bacterium]